MSSKRKILLQSIHTTMTGRIIGTLIQDSNQEADEQATVNYASLSNSPYNGNLWPELGEAIRTFPISDQQPGMLFFISQVIAHRSVEGGYRYYVEVSMVWNSFQVNCVAMKYELISASLINGFAIIGLGEFDGSGVQGYMAINWAALEDIGPRGYACQDYTDGALNPTVLPMGLAWQSVGNPAINPPIVTDDFDADGKIPLIYCNPGAETTIICTLKTTVNIKGPVTLKNIGAGDVQVVSADNCAIDGQSSGLVHGGKDATIRLYDDVDDPRFYTTGSFIPAEPP